METIKKYKILNKYILFFVRIILYFLTYYVFSEIINKPAFPKISQFSELFKDDYFQLFFKNLLPTLYRWLIIVVTGSITGVIFGVLIGYFHFLYKITNFEIDFFRSIPATLIITFVLVAFGDNEITRNLPSFYITFFTIIFYVSKQIKIIDEAKINHLKQLGAPYKFIIFHCLLYESMPVILIALRQAISLSFLVLVSIELIVGSSNNLGLGVMLYDYKDYLKYKEIIITIILIGLIGYFANYLFYFINKNVVYWKKVD